jgi:hypothetical protein
MKDFTTYGTPDGPSPWLEWTSNGRKAALQPTQTVPLLPALSIAGVFVILAAISTAIVRILMSQAQLRNSLQWGLPILAAGTGGCVLLVLALKQANYRAAGPILTVDYGSGDVDIVHYSCQVQLSNIRYIEFRRQVVRTGSGLIAKNVTVLSMAVDADGETKTFDLAINPIAVGGAGRLATVIATGLGVALHDSTRSS